MKSKSEAIPYGISNRRNTYIGQAIKRMCNEDQNVCSIQHTVIPSKNSHFPMFLLYLNFRRKKNDCAARNFTDTTGEVTKLNIKPELTNCKYFCVLSDGSTGSSMI